MPTKNFEVDPLLYVRERLAATPTAERARIAVDAGASLRTLQNIIEGKRDPHYGTVMKFYNVLSGTKAPAKRKAKKP